MNVLNFSLLPTVYPAGSAAVYSRNRWDKGFHLAAAFQYDLIMDVHIVTEYELRHSLRGAHPLFQNAISNGYFGIKSACSNLTQQKHDRHAGLGSLSLIGVYLPGSHSVIHSA